MILLSVDDGPFMLRFALAGSGFERFPRDCSSDDQARSLSARGAPSS
jgi:hypothetical protein